jgi:hypothetical protein
LKAGIDCHDRLAYLVIQIFHDQAEAATSQDQPDDRRKKRGTIKPPVCEKMQEILATCVKAMGYA